MLAFLAGMFVVINLLIRVPIRIALMANPNNEKLAKVDLVALVVTGFNFIGIIICALTSGEIDSASATACIVVFGGAMLLIIVPLSLSAISNRRYWIKLYNQTNQRPNEEDYGFSKDNPIWAGTYENYMKHLVAENGKIFKWKLSKKIDLPVDGGIPKLNGVWYCEMYKIKIIFNEEKIDAIYIVTKSGLDKMKPWHAPKGYKLI